MDYIEKEPTMGFVQICAEKIFIERNKKIDSLVLGEIIEIGKENGLEKHITLNEKAIVSALKKQIAKKVEVQRWIYTKCECGYEFSEHHGDGYYSIPYYKKTKYCPNCGQALDWD